MADRKLKVDDRVKRVSGKGSQGIIRDIRAEVAGSKGEAKEDELLVVIQWDNGTYSYATCNALEHA